MSTVFFISGISMMPLAEASAITQVAPVLLAVLAVRVLGEKAPPGTWSALAVSFVGVLLIVRPGGPVFDWAALLPLGTALCFVAYQLLTRKLAGVDDGLSTLFIGALVATVMASFIVPWYWQWPRSWAYWRPAGPTTTATSARTPSRTPGCGCRPRPARPSWIGSANPHGPGGLHPVAEASTDAGRKGHPPLDVPPTPGSSKE